MLPLCLVKTEVIVPKSGHKNMKTERETVAVIKAKRPHSADCRRYETGVWDRSGNCERCAAWIRLNELTLP